MARYDEILFSALALPVPDRARLIRRILRSLQEELKLDEAWLRSVEAPLRRLEEGEPVPENFAEARAFLASLLP